MRRISGGFLEDFSQSDRGLVAFWPAGLAGIGGAGAASCVGDCCILSRLTSRMTAARLTYGLGPDLFNKFLS